MMISRIVLAALLPLLLASCAQDEMELDEPDEELPEPGLELDEQGEELAVCDGDRINLLTDNQNCGECGRECFVWYPDTPYTAGGCANGECGPAWAGLYPALPETTSTCEERCQYGGRKCVARGCSGLTSFVCTSSHDLEELYGGFVEGRTGSCDEPMSADLPLGGADKLINCCCEPEEPPP